MVDPSSLANSLVSQAEPELREATVLDDATELGQEIRCVIPSLDPNLATDPMPWMPYGEQWPKRGDRAVIGRPPDGPPVILFWAPAPVAEVEDRFPFVSVDAHGAVGDGEADDSAAIEAALAAVASTGGTVLCGPRTYLYTGTIAVPAGVYLVGAGMAGEGSGLGTTLLKGANGALIDLSGESTESRHKYGGMRDLQVDGGNKTGALVRTYHADNLFFNRVHLANNFGIALDCVELWDSRFTDINLSSCGATSGEEPAWLIRSTIEGEGLGDSNDNANQIYIANVRIESWRDGGLWIEAGGEPFNGPLGIFIDNIKIESWFAGGPALRVGNTAKDIHLRNSYTALMALAEGVEPTNAIEWTAADRSSLTNVEIANGETETLKNGLYLWANNCAVTDVIGAYGTDPSEEHINIAGGGGYRFADPDLGSWFAVPMPASGEIAATANQIYYAHVVIPSVATITGVQYTVAGAGAGNVKAAIYDAAGTRLAHTTATVAQGGEGPQKVPFSSPAAVTPGVYYISLVFSSGSAKYYGDQPSAPSGNAAAGSFAAPASITPPTTSTYPTPDMTTY